MSMFDLLKTKEIPVIHAEYFISTSELDEKNLTYCFGRYVDGTTEIMLSKTMHDRSEFTTEVHNLIKYFQAQLMVS